MGHTGLWLVLLDGVEARLGSRQLSLGPPQRRAVLCALAFRPRQWVSPATLLAALYDDDVPASGIRVIQTYVSALRRILEPDRSSPTVLVSGHGGYQLRVDDENIDLAVFNRLVSEASRHREQGAWQQASQNYEQALALCGDEPLAGIPGPYAELQRVALAERRLGVIEDHLDLAVSLGRAGQAVDQLRTMIAEHPLRERPRGVLMRALSSRGRQAEALEVYAQARQVMIEHLGVEPSAELRALHSQILAGETPGESIEVTSPVTAESASPLVGRERALRRLAGAAAQARQGHGGLVLVSGPRGYGKTRVLTETAQREPDFRLVDLGAAGRRGRPADLARALGRGDSTAPDDDEALADLILQALTGVAAGGPLLLLVDNIVHTDPKTVRVLSLLAARLRATPVLLVLAMDGSPWAGADTDVDADGYTALEAEATAVIRLGGLDETAVAELVAQETGRQCPPESATEIHQATVGIPQLVRALITDLEVLPDHGSVPQHLPGSGYARALGQLLSHYAPGAAEVLRAVAVLHTHLPTVDLLAAVTDAPATEVRYHLEFHATCGLLATTDPPTFRHPLIANTLRWSCGRQAVDTMWLAAAHHARSTGQSARKIASYLRELTNASGARWVPVLLEAAHECLREDATQEAIGHLETALRIVPTAGRTDLLIRVAQLEQWIDPVTAQTHLEEALVAQRAARAKPTAAMPLVWLTSRQGHAEAALALLDEVIAETAVTDPDTATALRASTWMIAARTPTTWAGFLSRSRAQAADADPITMAVLALDDTFAVRCSAQQVLDRFPAEHNDNRDWDRLPRELISVLANITLYADDLTSTLQLCDRDADHHFASLDLYRLIMRAEALCRRGQFAVVLREFELLESTPLSRASGRPIGIVAQYAHALIGQGRIDDAERWLDSVTDHTHDSSWEWTMAKYATGLVRSARGAAREAAACFLDCGRRTSAWGMHNPGFMPWRSNAAVELHKIGEHHRARELATAELGIAERWAAPRTLGLAWRAVALTSADEAEKVPLLEQAAAHLRRSESVIELVLTLITLADAYAETDSPQRHQAVLDEALALADQTDADHLVTRIKRMTLALRER